MTTLLNYEQSFQLMSMYRLLDSLMWVIRGICCWYRQGFQQTNAPAEEAAHTAKHFYDINQQVIWHQWLLFIYEFHLWFQKTKRDDTFSRPYGKSTIWKARFYLSQFSFSYNVEENCQRLLLSSPATVQMFGKCKTRNETKRKPSKISFA